MEKKNELITGANSPILTTSEFNDYSCLVDGVDSVNITIDKIYSIGDYATIDGINSICVYKAESKQNWGTYIFADSHQAQYYYNGTDPADSTDMVLDWGFPDAGNVLPKNSYHSLSIDSNDESYNNDPYFGFGAAKNNCNALLQFPESVKTSGTDTKSTLWKVLRDQRNSRSNENWSIPTMVELYKILNLWEAKLLPNPHSYGLIVSCNYSNDDNHGVYVDYSQEKPDGFDFFINYGAGEWNKWTTRFIVYI